MSKIVVEFLQKNREATYEDLLNKIEVSVLCAQEVCRKIKSLVSKCLKCESLGGVFFGGGGGMALTHLYFAVFRQPCLLQDSTSIASLKTHFCVTPSLLWNKWRVTMRPVTQTKSESS